MEYGIQVRELTVKRKQDEIQRLKALRHRDVANMSETAENTKNNGKLSGGRTQKSSGETGAEWLHECVEECAKEASALSAAERAIDRRASALAALSDTAGQVRRGRYYRGLCS